MSVTNRYHYCHKFVYSTGTNKSVLDHSKDSPDLKFNIQSNSSTHIPTTKVCFLLVLVVCEKSPKLLCIPKHNKIACYGLF